MTEYRRNLTESKFGIFLNKLIIAVLAIFTFYLLYLNFSYSLQNNALIYSLLVIPAFFVVCFLAYRLNISPLAFAVTIFLLAFLFKGILVVMSDTVPVSDFKNFYQCAIKLIHGDKSFGHGFYFKTWAYQTGPVIYYAAIMKLLGTSLLPLELVNCFFMAGTNMLIYLVARKISNDYTARLAALLYLLYPAPYFLAPVLTNQHFAAFMFVLAIYILLNDGMNLLLRGVTAGLIMSVGNAIRPLGMVILGGTILWGLLEAIRLKKPARIGMIALLAASYLLLNLGLSAAVKGADINPEGLKNNFPLWKFVIGFNYSTQGRFSYEDQNNLFYIEDMEKRDTAAKQVIKERLSIGPRKLINLLDTKQRIMWADFDTIRWGFYTQADNQMVPAENVEKYEPGILRTEKVYYVLAFILMFIGLTLAFLGRKTNSGMLLLALLLLCYFGAHLFIEIQVRYRYFALVLVFILAAKGGELVMSAFYKYRRKYSLFD